jgi:hypothetical protein
MDNTNKNIDLRDALKEASKVIIKQQEEIDTLKKLLDKKEDQLKNISNFIVWEW